MFLTSNMQDSKGFSFLRQTTNNHFRLPKKLCPVSSEHQQYYSAKFIHTQRQRRSHSLHLNLVSLDAEQVMGLNTRLHHPYTPFSSPVAEVIILSGFLLQQQRKTSSLASAKAYCFSYSLPGRSQRLVAFPGKCSYFCSQIKAAREFFCTSN